MIPAFEIKRSMPCAPFEGAEELSHCHVIIDVDRCRLAGGTLGPAGGGDFFEAARVAAEQAARAAGSGEGTGACGANAARRAGDDAAPLPSHPDPAREALVEETLEGQRIPKNSLMMAVPYLLHRKPTLCIGLITSSPSGSCRGSGVPSKWAYLPFSIGPRTCAGMSFGLNEAVICLAILAQRFTLQLEPGHAVAPVC